MPRARLWPERPVSEANKSGKNCATAAAGVTGLAAPPSARP